MASLSFEVINVDDDPELFDESFTLTSQIVRSSESSMDDRHCSTSTLNSEPTSVSSIKSDATPEEIHAKLNNLIKQNSELKEKMQNSNKLIQDQLAVIEVWPRDIKHMNQKHQDVLRQLSDENEKLRKEKAELQKLVLNVENPTVCLHCDTVGDKVMKLEKEIDSLATIQKENFAGVLKQKSVIQEFKENIQRVQNELQIENKYLDDTKLNGIELSSRCSILPSNGGESSRVNDTVQHHSDFQSRNSELIQKLNEEKQKCENLEKSLKQHEEQIQILQYAFENSNRQEKKHIQLLMELDSVKEKLAAALNELSEAQEKCEDLAAKADHYKEQVHILEESDAKVIKKLQIEIKALQESLDEVTNNHHSDKHYLELELNKLSEERDQLLNRISHLEIKNKELKVENERMVQAHQEELDSVVARLVDAEQKLEVQKKKVSSEQKDSQCGIRSDSQSIGIRSDSQSIGIKSKHANRETGGGEDKTIRYVRCPQCFLPFCSSYELYSHMEDCNGLEYV